MLWSGCYSLWGQKTINWGWDTDREGREEVVFTHWDSHLLDSPPAGGWSGPADRKCQGPLSPLLSGWGHHSSEQPEWKSQNNIELKGCSTASRKNTELDGWKILCILNKKCVNCLTLRLLRFIRGDDQTQLTDILPKVELFQASQGCFCIVPDECP